MEGLIVVAVIWLIFSSIGKNAKKGRTAKRPIVPHPGNTPQMRPAADSSEGKSLHEDARPAGPAAMPQTVYRAAKHASSMTDGESLTDDEGCVGGSLPHEAHEGAYASGSLDYQPVVEYARRDADVKPAEPLIAHERAAVTPAQMRAAIVTAEILNRPVSMRRRGPEGRAIR